MDVPYALDNPQERPCAFERDRLEVERERRFDREGEGGFLFGKVGREDEGVDAGCVTWEER